MKPEDLSPEQKADFEAAVLASKSNMRHIVVPNVLLLITMQIVNMVICAQFKLPAPGPFFLVFFTTILVFSTTKSQLMNEADRFQEEAFKIFNNKQ